MAVFRKLHTSFWQDSFVLELTPEEKYFYIYLMTNTKTKQCGIYDIPKKVIEMETGYNRDTVNKLLQRFIEYGKIFYDETTNEICIINWAKYNLTRGGTPVHDCLHSELKKIKNKHYIKIIADTIKKEDIKEIFLNYVDDTYDESYDDTSTIRGQELRTKNKELRTKNKELRIKNKEKDIIPYDDDSSYMQWAKILQDKIIAVNNKSKARKANLQTWAKDIRLMQSYDERTDEEMHRLIEFIFKDQFWCNIIQSPSSLRKHWDKIWVQLNKASPSFNANNKFREVDSY